MLKKFRNLKLFKGDSTYSQLFRTYIVGGFNLVFGLGTSYIFQFFVFNLIEIPLRTYLTNIFSFSIGVIVSYFLSRRIIFKLPANEGGFKEFVRFLITNLINLVIPLFIWYLIDLIRPSIQDNEIQFLIAIILINGFILPIKYLIYKLFVFKDSLNN
jgi:putative flippase GtrA|tara:strand:+ start:239 stop:709 length:471 start_codon:yes stop_codon:yes gene_type:complete